MSKKTISKVAKDLDKKAHEVAEINSVKTTKPKKTNSDINIEHKVQLVTFSIKATIPTQQYGNMMPEIVVTAPTIEMARDTVMPIIEDLYQNYAETPLNGRIPTFYKTKASVTVVEKKVEPEVVGSNKPTEPVVSKSSEDRPAGPAVKTPAYIKAENAIAGAVGKDSIDLVHEKIKASVKLTDEEKSFLYDLIVIKSF